MEIYEDKVNFKTLFGKKINEIYNKNKENTILYVKDVTEYVKLKQKYDAVQKECKNRFA